MIMSNWKTATQAFDDSYLFIFMLSRYRFLRSQDREMNKNNYPQLHFPEVYLLHAGYKAFHETHKVR